MNDMKHTPGPWRVRRTSSNTFAILGAVQHKPGQSVAVVDTEDDARLIAAAPALLAALKVLMYNTEIIELLHDKDPMALAQARAAIAATSGTTKEK